MRIQEINGALYYKGYPIVESGRKWAIAKLPDGGFIRAYEGQEDKLFEALNAALDDCGVL